MTASTNDQSELTVDGVCEILDGGYNERVASFTRSIATNPERVMLFESIFDDIFFDALITWEATASQTVFNDRVHESWDALEASLGGPKVDFESFLVFTNHGPEATCEIGWVHEQHGQLVWDRWTQAVDDPVIAYADAGFQFTTKLYRCESRQLAKPLPPLYRFHPERFKAYREYSESIGKMYRQKVEPSTGMLTLDQLNQIAGIIGGELNAKGMRYPRREKDSHPAGMDVFGAETNLATAYGRFVQAGRQILDFPALLTEMLSKTDVDDIPLCNIKLPYCSQYLHFGPQADLEIEHGWLVDGAYVEARGSAGDIRFTVTAVPKDTSSSERWYLFGEVEYTQDFVVDFRTMDLGTAIDTVLSRTVSEFRDRQGKVGGDITSMVKEQLAERGELMPEGLSIVDVRPRMSEIREAMAMRRHPVYKAALQLVVNALCYATAYPEDIESVWPAGTPESLKAKLSSQKGKEQARARSKLAAMGYVPVHLCGRRVVEQRNAAASTACPSGQIASHWRRGHWRNQVHGTGRSLRKMIWLMPVMVSSKQGAEPDAGHLYLVS